MSAPSRSRRTRAAAPAGPDARGTEIEVEVGPVAHGGHCVARHEGRVVFVRHALPGERVIARVTEGAEGAKFWRADAVRVLEADADRVEPPCPVARPGRCGGCDFQHVTLARQRELKAAVVAEQFRRLASLDVDVTVEEAPGSPDGLRWRTRTQFAVDAEGRPGLRVHRSHAVVPLDDCPISTAAVVGSGVLGQRYGNVETLEVAAGSDGAAPLVVATPAPGTRAHLPKLPEASVALRTPEGLHRVSGRTWVGERIAVRGREHAFRVGGAGFWQVHPAAPELLGEAVLAALEPRAGERALDLYSGVGLFTALLADAVGAEGSVLAVEGSERAVRDARKSLHELGQVELWAGAVEDALADPELPARGTDLVVLDPPRSGAGRAVVAGIADLAPRAIAYVACDPAALARDTAFLAERGYALDGLRAFDLFPMTHHVECVARFVRAA
ncbi:TRAM domain-containing protein [Kineococcus aurantiacus]|uniref:tRNA/tmRNA/rRNA uracil-C5-methylase (TrmA/RlmC/RlmD family) n=1 Tax=Kineococcus aurantiacus TaxID=37633 RepID=A0A7Y9DPM1_9ACTN|nr:tRNA/tmRNA/rRNA uracil-C5-methylase (TrmA/RlmC/RlmD family) [Kineococcus aurantiacus]